jgi:hypothetical protein
VQRESVSDSLFESGGLFFSVPFAVVVHGVCSTGFSRNCGIWCCVALDSA